MDRSPRVRSTSADSGKLATFQHQRHRFVVADVRNGRHFDYDLLAKGDERSKLIASMRNLEERVVLNEERLASLLHDMDFLRTEWGRHVPQEAPISPIAAGDTTPGRSLAGRGRAAVEAAKCWEMNAMQNSQVSTSCDSSYTGETARRELSQMKGEFVTLQSVFHSCQKSAQCQLMKFEAETHAIRQSTCDFRDELSKRIDALQRKLEGAYQHPSSPLQPPLVPHQTPGGGVGRPPSLEQCVTQTFAPPPSQSPPVPLAPLAPLALLAPGSPPPAVSYAPASAPLAPLGSVSLARPGSVCPPVPLAPRAPGSLPVAPPHVSPPTPLAPLGSVSPPAPHAPLAPGSSTLAAPHVSPPAPLAPQTPLGHPSLPPQSQGFTAMAAQKLGTALQQLLHDSIEERPIGSAQPQVNEPFDLMVGKFAAIVAERIFALRRDSARFSGQITEFANLRDMVDKKIGKSDKTLLSVTSDLEMLEAKVNEQLGSLEKNQDLQSRALQGHIATYTPRDTPRGENSEYTMRSGLGNRLLG